VWSTKSPMRGSFTTSRSKEAALFRVKRWSGECIVGGSNGFSGRTCFREPRRLESVEMLTGDRGVCRLEWLSSVDTDIMNY
jgi:hypothetical protein